ncbi:MAG: hypothetical protein JKY31_12010 [Rhodobacteraceae bacterium]|nr:hypothetical protein [Paracoccaceae bacterium]
MADDSVNFFLNKTCSLPFAVKGSSYGWFIDVRDPTERSFSGRPYPSDIIDCYTLAIKVDCSFILFDRDAERHPDLEWFGDTNQEAYDDRVAALGSPAVRGPYLLNDIKALFNR